MDRSPSQSLLVHAWPQVLTAGLPLPVPISGLIVIQVATDGDQTSDRTSDRTSARARVREAVLQVLAAALALSPDRIVLTSTPGQAPRLVLSGERAAGLSISHEAGLSLAAINLHGPIGVDLMRVPKQDQCDDLIDVARDYLGPAQAVALARLLPSVRPIAFATAWAAHEASLKCQGLALTEWLSPSMPAPLVPVVPLFITALDLPAPFIGVIATPG